MRVLLDTQIYLWFLADSRRLRPRARRRIGDADVVFVSAASVWEATIKAWLRKLDVNVSELVEQIPASGFVELPVRQPPVVCFAAWGLISAFGAHLPRRVRPQRPEKHSSALT